MNQITIQVPPAFLPVIDELVRLNQAGTREQWLAGVVRGIAFDYQLRKEFTAPSQARLQQLNGLWPAPAPQPQPSFPATGVRS